MLFSFTTEAHIIRVECSPDARQDVVFAAFFAITNTQRNSVTRKPECSVANEQSTWTIHHWNQLALKRLT